MTRLFIASILIFSIFSLIQPASSEPSGRGPFECTDTFYRLHRCEPMRPANWQGVESDNGQNAYVDIESVKYRVDFIPPYGNGRKGKVARALVFFDDGMQIGVSNAGWYDFDCEGPYLIGQAGVGTPQSAQFLPTRSAGYEIRSIACGVSN